MGREEMKDVAQFVFPDVVLAVKLSLMALVFLSKNWPSWQHLATGEALVSVWGMAGVWAVCQAQGLCSLLSQQRCAELNRSPVGQRTAPLSYTGAKSAPKGARDWSLGKWRSRDVSWVFGLFSETLYDILVPISMHIYLQAI